MNSLPLFIGISGAEIAFILFIVIMVFGADKIPEIARGLGKGMRSIRNATDEIKGEVMRSAEKNGVDTSFKSDITSSIEKVKEEIEEITGSVKRRF